MTILRVGSNAKYSQGWDQVFGKKKSVKTRRTARRTSVKRPKIEKK